MNEPKQPRLVIGVDYGSDSARAIVADAETGTVLSSAISMYPRWKQGLYQHPAQAIFRQHPMDYLDALETCVRGAVAELTDEQKACICGIGVDTTGSTPAPVDETGCPLALKPEFAEHEGAMFHLWKDHSAQAEAEELDRLFRTGSSIDYTAHQGTYSAEWFWAKILHTVRTCPEIRQAAYAWVEHCDWMTGLLAGDTGPDTMYRCACAAGHKALYHSDWNGYPSEELLTQADPYLVQVLRHMGGTPGSAMLRVGSLCKEWAERLGIPEGIAVSGCSFDAHAGAVGAGARPKIMVSAIGTSAVDMLVAKAESIAGKDISRFGGKAENSILPNYVGIETGQAAFGDIFAWFKRLLLWPVEQAKQFLPEESWNKLYEAMEDKMLVLLQNAAEEAEQNPDADFPVALDWFNGRRYPDTDDLQRATISGLSLGSDAPAIYRAIVFGAVSGLKRIVDGFLNAGIEIERLVAVGGISKKSSYIMQLMADLLGMEIDVLDADQTCAIGAAMYAAVGAGIYDDAEACTAHMAAKVTRTYIPNPARGEALQGRYEAYLKLCGETER